MLITILLRTIYTAEAYPTEEQPTSVSDIVEKYRIILEQTPPYTEPAILKGYHKMSKCLEIILKEITPVTDIVIDFYNYAKGSGDPELQTAAHALTGFFNDWSMKSGESATTMELLYKYNNLVEFTGAVLERSYTADCILPVLDQKAGELADFKLKILMGKTFPNLTIHSIRRILRQCDKESSAIDKEFEKDQGLLDILRAWLVKIEEELDYKPAGSYLDVVIKAVEFIMMQEWLVLRISKLEEKAMALCLTPGLLRDYVFERVDITKVENKPRELAASLDVGLKELMDELVRMKIESDLQSDLFKMQEATRTRREEQEHDNQDIEESSETQSTEDQEQGPLEDGQDLHWDVVDIGEELEQLDIQGEEEEHGEEESEEIEQEQEPEEEQEQEEIEPEEESDGEELEGAVGGNELVISPVESQSEESSEFLPQEQESKKKKKKKSRKSKKKHHKKSQSSEEKPIEDVEASQIEEQEIAPPLTEKVELITSFTSQGFTHERLDRLVNLLSKFKSASGEFVSSFNHLKYTITIYFNLRCNFAWTLAKYRCDYEESKEYLALKNQYILLTETEEHIEKVEEMHDESKKTMKDLVELIKNTREVVEIAVKVDEFNRLAGKFNKLLSTNQIDTPEGKEISKQLMQMISEHKSTFDSVNTTNMPVIVELLTKYDKYYLIDLLYVLTQKYSEFRNELDEAYTIDPQGMIDNLYGKANGLRKLAGDPEVFEETGPIPTDEEMNSLLVDGELPKVPKCDKDQFRSQNHFNLVPEERRFLEISKIDGESAEWHLEELKKYSEKVDSAIAQHTEMETDHKRILLLNQVFIGKLESEYRILLEIVIRGREFLKSCYELLELEEKYSRIACYCGFATAHATQYTEYPEPVKTQAMRKYMRNRRLAQENREEGLLTHREATELHKKLVPDPNSSEAGEMRKINTEIEEVRVKIFRLMKVNPCVKIDAILQKYETTTDD